jgi:RHS repeat-associated protein
MFNPITAIAGHRHVMHLAYEQEGCGNCGASAFIGDEPDVYPLNILAFCGAAYGPSSECASPTFISPGNALYIDMNTVPWLSASSGIIRVVDLDLPPGVYDLSSRSGCRPKDGEGGGDERECQVNGTTNSQGEGGDPINTRTGVFSMVLPELSVNTAAGPLLFQRTYSSDETDLPISSLGPGWTHNQDSRLIFPDDPGGVDYTVLFKAHTANFYPFVKVGNGTFEAYPGVMATLVRNNGPPRTYTLTNRAQQVYTFDEDGALLIWTNAAGNSFQYEYDGFDRLEKVQDDSGSRYFTFTYDAQDRLINVADHAGRQQTFTYNGNLETMTDASGEIWTYSYDADQRLTQITDPHGVAEMGVEYDEDGRALRQYDGLDRLIVELDYISDSTTTLTDAIGNTTTHIYDTDRGVLEQEIDPVGGITERTYDDNLRLETITDPLGNVTSMEWSEDGHNLERILDAAGFETVMDYNAANRLEVVRDALTHVTTFDYAGNLLETITDALNNSTSFTYTTPTDSPQPPGMLKSVKDALLQMTSYTYTSLGDLETMLDAHGEHWAYAYNAWGWLEQAADPRRVKTRYAYDELGRITEVIRNYHPFRAQNDENLYNIITHFHYDAVGNLVDLIDTENKVTHFDYDDAYQLVEVVENYRPAFSADQETNVRSELSYDEIGNTIAVIDPLGTITRTYYDELYRPVRVVQNLTSWDIENASPPPFDPAHPDENVPTVYTYDAASRLIQMEDALGTISHACYDPRGLPVKSVLNPTVANPCPGYSPSVASDRDVIQMWSFDAVGNLKTTTDPLARVTSYGNDLLNRLTTVTDPLGFVTTFGYDPIGNRISMTDPEGVVTHYAYDPLNRLDEVLANYQSGGPTDHQTNVRTTYAYDPVGNLERVTDAVGSEWGYTYNALDRLIGEVDPLGHDWVFDYSAVGELTHRADPKGFTTIYAYDAINRLVGIDFPGSDPDVNVALDAVGNPLSMLDGLGQTSWSYDGLYRPTTINDPVGMVVGYAYDAVGNRTGITYPDSKSVGYDYNLVQRLELVTDWDAAQTTYSYDKAGQPLSASLPNGISSSFEWDAGGRLKTLEHAFNTQTIASYAYEYDRLGNRSQAGELLAKPVISPAGPYVVYLPLVSGNGSGVPPKTIAYEYDPLYRLTAADYSSGEYFTYTYDAVGNRLSQETDLGSNAYDYDAAHRLIEVDGTSYTWDDNGNLLSDGERSFTYDHADRLTAVNSPGGAYSFGYDGLGNRYQQTLDAATTTYSLDIAAGLTQVLADGSSASLYGLGRIGEDSSGGWGYHLSDALGSSRQLANSSGQVTFTQSYEPFGAPMTSTGDATSGFGFTGEQDGIAGLVFLRARFYDPDVGRFLTKDPFPGLASLPSTQHPYAYALDNPLRYTDPSGKVIPILLGYALAGLAGGILGGLGYYVLRQLAAADPCAGVDWDWGEAFFWAGAGGLLGIPTGVAIGTLLEYLGLWVITRAGGLSAPLIQQVIDVSKSEMAQIAQTVNWPHAEYVVKQTWQSASVTYGAVNQFIIYVYSNSQHIATIHRVETLAGELTHMDFKSMVIEGIKYIVR